MVLLQDSIYSQGPPWRSASKEPLEQEEVTISQLWWPGVRDRGVSRVGGSWGNLLLAWPLASHGFLSGFRVPGLLEASPGLCLHVYVAFSPRPHMCNFHPS